MPASTLEEITCWVDRGYANDACTHVVVVCDKFDWEDFPVYVTAAQDVRAILARYARDENYLVMEVYSTAVDRDEQLAQRRAWNV